MSFIFYNRQLCFKTIHLFENLGDYRKLSFLELFSIWYNVRSLKDKTNSKHRLCLIVKFIPQRNVFLLT